MDEKQPPREAPRSIAPVVSQPQVNGSQMGGGNYNNNTGMGTQMMNGGGGAGGANPGNSDALYIGDLQWVRLSFASFLLFGYCSESLYLVVHSFRVRFFITVDHRRRPAASCIKHRRQHRTQRYHILGT
jgi:hypothetical protein